MPTLQRRVWDGEYYVRHFFHQHNTWQVLGEGVRVLRNRGVTEGSRFSTDLFMELWVRRLVYHGSAIPSGELRPSRDAGVADSLTRRVGEFYRLVYAQKAVTAWSIVAMPVFQDDEDPEAVHTQFLAEVSELGLTGWKCTDSHVYQLRFEVVREGQPIFEATRIGYVHVRLSLRAGQRDVKQYWLYADGKWWLMWQGFHATP